MQNFVCLATTFKIKSKLLKSKSKSKVKGKQKRNKRSSSKSFYRRNGIVGRKRKNVPQKLIFLMATLHMAKSGRLADKIKETLNERLLHETCSDHEKASLPPALPPETKATLEVPLHNMKFCQEVSETTSNFVNDEFIISTAVHDDHEDVEFFCMSTAERPVHQYTFDTDSVPIGVDTFASRCISPYAKDFVKGSLHRSTSNIKPYEKGSTLAVEAKGTIEWKIQSDDGTIHTVLIQNALYAPGGCMRLLSPQHVAQDATIGGQKVPTFSSEQLINRNVLAWGPSKAFIKVIPNSSRSNVPILFTAPSAKTYEAFAAEATSSLDTEECTIKTDSGSSNPGSNNPPAAEISETQQMLQQNEYEDENFQSFIHNNLNTAEISEVQSDQELAQSATTWQAELLRWHYRLGHVSFQKLQRMAKLGYIPKQLANVRIPTCAGCFFGKQGRTPWRVKGQNNKLRMTRAPGECVSVDQMESSSAGSIGQIKSRLTKRRHKYTVVFVDHYSRYVYVHLQERLTGEETVLAKQSFEQHMKSFGIQVKHYHADNGRFADNTFLQAVKESKQSISFCAVNAHWQNGIAEKTIRDLREMTRTQLLHSLANWPSALDVALWTYSLRYAAHVRNNVPMNNKTKSPLELLTNSETAVNLRHFHSFGCPVFVLNNKLQAQQHIKHWLPRSRLGIYLGPSPKHARSVSLVLNIHTGLVSPQFHVRHDNFFESTKGKL